MKKKKLIAYETEKAKLEALNLSHEEYEKRIRKLIKKLKY